MYSESLQRVRFIYRGPSVEAVYDRLLTAKAKRREDGTWLVVVEALGPEGLQEEVAGQLCMMAAYYGQ